jgi:hypothetical protein
MQDVLIKTIDSSEEQQLTHDYELKIRNYEFKKDNFSQLENNNTKTNYLLTFKNNSH